MLFTDHSTVVIAVFVIVPVNATLVRHLRVIVLGEMATVIGSVEDVVALGGGVTLTCQVEATKAPTLASTFAVPTPVAVTWPRLLILATKRSLVFHAVNMLP
jgi:hypothetical protein